MDPVTGSRLRAARESVGLSLSALAARTHYSKALLGLLETGQRQIRPEHVSAYSRALGVSVQTLTSAPDDPLRVAHEWLVNETPAVVHSRAGHRVGESLAGELEQRVKDIRRLDDSIGGRDLFPVVSKELRDVESVVRDGSYSARIERRLLTVVGELSQLGGWVASDAGHFAEARRIYLDGHRASAAAGNRALAAQLLSTLAYQQANTGDAADALLLARSAVAGARDATPVTRALLWERVAWASARARDTDSARRALDTVDDAYDDRKAEVPEPDWVYWLNRDEIDIMAARCFVELGDGSTAQPLLTRAIDAYPAEHQREVALYRTWLAEAFAKSGQFDAAADTLALIAGDIGSDRVERRLQDVRQLLYT
ncbi:helix-turn-helix domain-containing protein [Nocardia sp. NPDC004068]|uniref:helix-turn-helix domain-containing protein n=1 Tax=Nocardia sp. NPDC004068 TaxID=3364303 RepID=UPI0036BBCB7B